MNENKILQRLFKVRKYKYSKYFLLNEGINKSNTISGFTNRVKVY